MSALPPKADICSAPPYVRFGPKADICSAKLGHFFSSENVQKAVRKEYPLRVNPGYNCRTALRRSPRRMGGYACWDSIVGNYSKDWLWLLALWASFRSP